MESKCSYCILRPPETKITHRHNMLDLFLPAPSLLFVPHLSFGWLMACQCQALINYDQPLLQSLLRGPSGNSRRSGTHCLVKQPVCEGRFGSISMWLACGGICHLAGEKNSSLHCLHCTFLGVLNQTEDPGLGCVHMHTCGTFKGKCATCSAALNAQQFQKDTFWMCLQCLL